MIDKNKYGIIFGCFIAIIHAVWALMVAIIPGGLQSYLNWILRLHFLKPFYILTAFNITDAILLVIITFVCGYIFGWVFAAVRNMVEKKKK